MLQIQNIKKKYVTGELTQTALDDVSLTFREHELVAILGPSGSGKSTLLNVIGGLDHYDSGDLIIDGISTKQYTDRDWDSYRNHTVGFIFQSYNLIPHQTVLSNVELALTISGIPAGERKKRAIQALENVGLGSQLHKKPNQMSGGQMQRVAIARALVNDPRILLADEPTGALDSETSIQVMELLKEVAKDRLVVMVTHNPELADQYASRIVRVKDGRILDDSDPFQPDDTQAVPPQHKNMGRSSMSFRSALTLSFQNLWTKKARTLLTSFAGSIGIIGIALILSLSTGFQSYVDSIQRDTLASYPLTIQSESADMSAALMSMMMPDTGGEEQPPDTAVESPMLSKMFAHIGSNDLSAFKTYLDENSETLSQMVANIQYGYGIRPRIYAGTPDKPQQVNPATLFKKITGNDGISAMMDSDAFQELMDDREMLDSQYDVVRGRWPEKYDELVFVLPQGGRIPDQIAYTLGLKDMAHLDEMLRLMEEGKEIPPEVPMQWSYDDLMNLRFRWVSQPDLYHYNAEFQIWEDLSDDPEYLAQAMEKGTELRVVGIIAPKEGSSGILYPGIGYHHSLTDHIIRTAANAQIVKDQLANPEVDVFSGSPFGSDEKTLPDFSSMISIDQNAISSSFGMDMSESDFVELLETCLQEITKATDVDTAPAQREFSLTLADLSQQMLIQYLDANGGTATITLSDAQPMVDDFLSGDYANGQLTTLANIYGVPKEAFVSVYKPLLVGMVTGFIAREIADQPAAPAFASHASAPRLASLTAVSETQEEAAQALPAPDGSPEIQPSQDAEPEIEPIPEATVPDGTSDSQQPPAVEPQPEQPTEDSTQPETAPDPQEPSENIEGTEESEPQIPDLPIRPDDFSADLTYAKIDGIVSTLLNDPVTQKAGQIMARKMMEATAMDSLVDSLSGFDQLFTQFIQDSFYVDSGRLAGAFRFDMDEEKLHRLYETISGRTQASLASNLRKLDYADLDSPSYMSIYMKDFDGKEAFLNFLDDYNRDMEESGHEEQIIQYTDMTGQMMDSVRIIINSVSYVLIAFVAVSLVVSSIMIGIITYISVMERTKEIGVLRAMGASKHNISQVFNAETFIIGLCSGVLGIGISLILLIPGNQLIHHLTKNMQIVARLPLAGALILIVLSMLLTLLGGLIPAMQAAKKDPVIALRSE